MAADVAPLLGERALTQGACSRQWGSLADRCVPDVPEREREGGGGGRKGRLRWAKIWVGAPAQSREGTRWLYIIRKRPNRQRSLSRLLQSTTRRSCRGSRPETPLAGNAASQESNLGCASLCTRCGCRKAYSAGLALCGRVNSAPGLRANTVSLAGSARPVATGCKPCERVS